MYEALAAASSGHLALGTHPNTRDRQSQSLLQPFRFSAWAPTAAWTPEPVEELAFCGKREERSRFSHHPLLACCAMPLRLPTTHSGGVLWAKLCLLLGQHRDRSCVTT